jgi:hypothetical protein
LPPARSDRVARRTPRIYAAPATGRLGWLGIVDGLSAEAICP